MRCFSGCFRTAFLASAVLGLTALIGQAQITVNEIEYDEVSTDNTEYIELAGTGGTSLSGWSLVLYNGSGGTAYLTVDLTPAGSMPVDGYLVVGSATVANVDLVAWTSNGVQNGAPDGLALVNNGAVVEVHSYEGSFVAVGGAADGMTLPDIGVIDTGDGSPSRCPDGSGGFIIATNTPGEANNCPPPADHIVTASGFSFSPDELTINVGETVRWDWVNGVHTVTEGTDGTVDGDELFHSALDSGTPFFTYTFTEPGVVNYFCEFHFAFGMTGTITVNDVGDPTGACCAADGTCTEVTEANCGLAGGTYSGDGTTCSPNNCPQPPATGACCAEDGTCTEVTEADCGLSGGTYSGDGTNCSPNNCPQPPGTGACCYDGLCADGLTEADCIATFDGEYQGDGTDCGSANCEIAPPAAVVINEVWADDPSTDTVEFVELFGDPGTLLYNYSLIIVDGDTAGDTNSSSYLQVDYQYDFGLTDALDANGFFLLGTLAGSDVGFAINELENGTVTYAIVPTADIAYDPLDTDALTDDSAETLTTTAIDTVATADSTPLDHTYFNAPVIKDGTFEADYMQRLPNGVDTDTTNDWATQFGFEQGAPGDASSPDAVNHPALGACCQADGSCSELSEADCGTAGGIWSGQGSTCEPNTCPQPVGACCDSLGGCTEVSDDDCAVSGGTYQGDGTLCGDGSICLPPPDHIVINEVWSDDPSTDDVEYIELYGAPNASLDGMSLIGVDGDTGGDPTNSAYLQVDTQIDFGPTHALDANGFFVVGSIVGADIGFAVNELENGTQTFALVATADIAYCIEDPENPGFPVGTCDDIDTDELTPESDAAISANATDAVATSDSGAGDHVYFAAPVVQDGTFQADFMHRIPNGVDTDSTADWQVQFGFEFGAAGDASTPDAPNAAGVGACCTGEACTIVSQADCEGDGGAYQGQGSLCEPADLCSLQTGACCTAGSCADLTPAECTAALGEFAGTGTTCAETDCSVACTTAADARLAADDTEVNICAAVVVSTTDLISSSTVKGLQIEDATGGVTVFGSNEAIDVLLTLVAEGDQLDLVGSTDSFSGLFELAAPFGPSNIVAGVGVPTPDAITVADMQDGSATAEGFESELVTMNGVTFLAADGVATFAALTNYNVSSDGGATIAIVRIATADLDLVGQVIPTGVVNVTGIFSQFDSTDPFNGGYQLLPRKLADIEVVPTEPTGACCDGATCTDGVTEDDCTTGGGEYQGDDSVCDAYTCGCEGDANGDTLVDPLDAGFVQARFGCPVGTGDADCDAADVNGDGFVDPLDVGYVLARFGTCN